MTSATSRQSTVAHAMCGIVVLLSSGEDPCAEAEACPMGRLQASDFVSMLGRRGPDHLGEAHITLPPSTVRGREGASCAVRVGRWRLVVT